jgi:uncharacterized membrane protein
VGACAKDEWGQHAFIYRHGKARDIHPNELASSTAMAINEHGQIVGHGWSANQDRVLGFLLDPIERHRQD